MSVDSDSTTYGSLIVTEVNSIISMKMPLLGTNDTNVYKNAISVIIDYTKKYLTKQESAVRDFTLILKMFHPFAQSLLLRRSLWVQLRTLRRTLFSQS